MNDMETLEEYLERGTEGIIEPNVKALAKSYIRYGAEWQKERMYSGEDLIRFMQFIVSQESLQNTSSVSKTTAMYYINQFKNK